MDAALRGANLSGSDIDFLAVTDGSGDTVATIPMRQLKTPEATWVPRAIQLLALLAVMVFAVGLGLIGSVQSRTADQMDEELAAIRQSIGVAKSGGLSQFVMKKSDASVAAIWDELSRILPDDTYLSDLANRGRQGPACRRVARCSQPGEGDGSLAPVRAGEFDRCDRAGRRRGQGSVQDFGNRQARSSRRPIRCVGSKGRIVTVLHSLASKLRRSLMFIGVNLALTIFVLLFVVAPLVTSYMERADQIAESRDQLARIKSLQRTAQASGLTDATSVLLPGTDEGSGGRRSNRT